mmetsp:Transcript_16617/g.20708  ORF Transcript_16617/g.20708 Transcript_16617/m.20708 type:complete len:267 (-) Transcript_16617:149-949(-)|eukprot:CAMPEP_0172522806 /NCGR_PEP_ID=MMETSP1066-20121228/293323_1 /TAXON_ID=671091 /ORGANISM="Coscinodiscus wailesii, Strain CCMP2513" /LENGTH=266 /DNA_ID=CAMNT_0013305839 /DNA_START=165 /DNA_END=965 /DNA_ORIENTATION=+
MVSAESAGMVMLSPTGSNSMWPTISETINPNGKESNADGDSFDWEFVSTEQAEDANTTSSPREICSSGGLTHCMSTPSFSDYVYFDENTVSSCYTDSGRSLANTDSNSVVIIPPKPEPTEKLVKVKRVPSFKDAILLNAQEKAKEEEVKKQKAAKLHATRARRIGRAKLVVTPISKRSLSTNDLKSLVRISESDDTDDVCVGGGGGSICENAVMGDTDATEFYERKMHGSKTRKNGLKLRPDEAKRKEFIMHKKNAQRQRQAARKN